MLDGSRRHDERVMLIEIVVAVALLGMVATALLAALATGMRLSVNIEDQTVSASLVTSQLEDTLSQGYVEPADYPSVSVPEGFSLSFNNFVIRPTLLERITVAVSSAAEQLFTITTHKVNTAFVASPPSLLLAQRDFRWFTNLDGVTPATGLALENTAYTITSLAEVVRLRMSLQVDRLPITPGQESFKLQYATDQAGPWSDVGSAASATATWRGFNNLSPVDGAVLPSVLLSGSSVAQSYEEENPSVPNPNAVSVGGFAEWDWVVQENGASFNTNYLFQMVKADGTQFGSYTRYPVLVMPPPTILTQLDYRWFDNSDSLSPGAALAPLHTAYTAATHGRNYRLRLGVKVDGLLLSPAQQAFKLQYATSTLGPWNDVASPGSGATWTGFDNPSVVDGASISTVLLPTSDVGQSYEEANPSVANPNALAVDQVGEWDWTLLDNGAADSTSYFFRMVKDDTSPLNSYTFYPEIITPPAFTLDQQDYRWFDNVDSLTPTTPLADENSSLTGTGQQAVLRLRVNLEGGGSNLAAGVRTFKLQYATNVAGPWSDVGSAASGEIWRGFDNPTSTDGATLPGLLLSTSTVAQSYEEQNPSVANPNVINAGQRSEWDWVLENNGAVPSTTYFFRMVEAGGTQLDTYTRHPEVTTAPAGQAQQDYRWFENRNHQDPISPLAAENTPHSGVSPLTLVRLRMSLAATGAVLPAGSRAFKLQYATSTGGPWSEVGTIGAAEIWRGFDNSLIADGTTISDLLLANSDVLETYEEANPSPANPNAIPNNQQGEWDWVLQNNSAPAGTFFFRMVRDDGTPLDAYVRYPEVATVAPTLTQRDYRWFSNVDGLTPTTSLAAENISTTGVTPGSVLRLRMNVEAAGIDLPASSQTFRLQFTGVGTSTGPWTDVGGAASSTVWRGFDNASVADGATITTLLLSSSDVAESYEEENPTVLNPNALLATTTRHGEWDWVIEDRLAPTGTFFFRVVKGDGTPLDGYTNYPEVAAAGPRLTQEDYRWYGNEDSLTPTQPLAGDNSPFVTTTHLAALRLRMNVEVTDSSLLAGSQAFNLQYSTDTAGPWTDVGGLGSGEVWRGFDNPSVADGTTITTVLATSTVAASYEETNSSVVNPNAVGIGQRAEWDWVLQANGAAASTTSVWSEMTARCLRPTPSSRSLRPHRPWSSRSRTTGGSTT